MRASGLIAVAFVCGVSAPAFAQTIVPGGGVAPLEAPPAVVAEQIVVDPPAGVADERGYAVRLSSAGILDARFGTAVGGRAVPASAVTVNLIQDGRIVASGVQDGSGTTSIANVTPGAYSMIAVSPEGYCCSGLKVLPATSEVGASGLNVQLVPNTDFDSVTQFFAGVMGPQMTEVGGTPALPGGIRGKYGRDIQSPIRNPVLRVRPDGWAVGRVFGANLGVTPPMPVSGFGPNFGFPGATPNGLMGAQPAGNPYGPMAMQSGPMAMQAGPVPVQGTAYSPSAPFVPVAARIALIRNGAVVASTNSDAEGWYGFNGLVEGTYTMATASEGAFAAFSVDVELTNADDGVAAVDSEGRFLVAMPVQAVPAPMEYAVISPDASGYDPLAPVYLPPPAFGPPGPFAPPLAGAPAGPGGGFGGGFGGGAGGGFGGGRLVGLLGLAGLGVGLAALLDDDDDDDDSGTGNGGGSVSANAAAVPED